MALISSFRPSQEITLERPRRESIQRPVPLPIVAVEQVVEMHTDELADRREATRFERFELRSPSDVCRIERQTMGLHECGNVRVSRATYDSAARHVHRSLRLALRSNKQGSYCTRQFRRGLCQSLRRASALQLHPCIRCRVCTNAGPTGSAVDRDQRRRPMGREYGPLRDSWTVWCAAAKTHQDRNYEGAKRILDEGVLIRLLKNGCPPSKLLAEGVSLWVSGSIRRYASENTSLPNRPIFAATMPFAGPIWLIYTRLLQTTAPLAQFDVGWSAWQPRGWKAAPLISANWRISDEN